LRAAGGEVAAVNVGDRLIPRIPERAGGEDPSGQKLAEVDYAS